MVHRHYLVSGRVQGVGFRAFTERRGKEIGLRGRVRNLRDGRVEIVASGSPEKIRDFESAIFKGPSHSRVDELVTKDIASTSDVFDNVQGFEREADGETPWTP